jgi:hypothetical protein
MTAIISDKENSGAETMTYSATKSTVRVFKKCIF